VLRNTFLFFLLSIAFGCNTNHLLPQRKEELSKAPSAILFEGLENLNFLDSSDFVNANRGFIATLKDPIIRDKSGVPVRDLRSYDFIKGVAPSTVNPSLWRQSALNSLHGLYKVTDGIYQIRGFDLANMTIVEGVTGWIIIDPLTAAESSAAGMALVQQELGSRPIKAVIFTHSHIDHFGGIRGIVSEEDITSGKIKLLAPEGFYEHALSENVIAGNAMLRRALYMYGPLIPTGPEGMVGSGLGQNNTFGSNGVLKPNKIISQASETIIVDGIQIDFENTPGAEAPSEMMFYFPKYKAFCQAEEINHTLHNLYTLRGAHVRNGLKWAKYIDNTIVKYGDKTEISFGSHHWPTWGKEPILKFWEGQRNTYKYIHDRTLHLANQGYNMDEIADMIELPKEMASQWANRDYYGSISHNAKAQYQLYYGWFDGNPANLNPLPTVEESERYVRYMGGAQKVIGLAREDFENRNYRWVATVLNKVVFADPSNQEARNLLADTYTKLGYATENAPWRNFYLTGASELRNGINTSLMSDNKLSNSPDIITNMPLETFYNYLAVRLDADKAKGKQYSFNLIFPDIDTEMSVYLEHQILYNRMGILAENPTATITMNKSIFNKIITQQTTGMKMALAGNIKMEGDRQAYQDFQTLVSEPFNLLFNIIEP
jgi:alkyl sulfatase BDS1-like metallo-beta-lactamase superfamily hydrolase